MNRELQTPWWRLYRLSPVGDRFRVVSEIDNLVVGEIPFETGEMSWPENIDEGTRDDVDLKHMLEAMEWWTSFFGDTKKHRRDIVEFHLANSSITQDYLRVYWKDSRGEWQHESWGFYRYDLFLEIIPPFIKSSFDIKRFDLSFISSLQDALFWLFGDIAEVTKGRDYCLWVDFGNR